MRDTNVDKSKITIVILSIVFALSMSVTITLAAFSANKSGDLTLTFADGLTMRLEPVGGNYRFKITEAGVDDYTFSYEPTTNKTGRVPFDGIIATLNKSAWVSYQISIWEIISNNAVVAAGEWRYEGRYHRFYPSGNKSNWAIGWTLNVTNFSYTASGNVLTQNGTAAWESDSLSKELFSDWEIRNRDLNIREYVDDLAGRTLEVRFTIKAQTDQAPTF